MFSMMAGSRKRAADVSLAQLAVENAVAVVDGECTQAEERKV